MDILASVPGAKAIEASVNRLAATAVNGIEVLRQGGLETGATASQFTVYERSPMFRLRRYFDGEDGKAPAGAQGQDGSKGSVDTRPPILLVPPLMVDANVFDVTSDKGAVSVLHRAGLDPWVIDFGSPDREEGGLERNLADHVVALSKAIDRIVAVRGRDVHVGGYSQGGMFCYQVAAFRQSKSVASVITFGSPVDISSSMPLGAPPALVNKGAEFVADHVFNRFFLPGWMARRGFELLNPVKAVRSRVDFVRQLHDRAALLPREDQRRFLESDGWVAYSGPAVADLLRQFVVHNRMLTGGFSIEGEAVSLASITCPVLAFIGRADQIGRPSAVRGILQAAPSAEVFEAELGAGHFGLVVGTSAGAITYPTVAEWVAWREGRGSKPENVVPMEPRDGGDPPVNPLVAGAAGLATVGFITARDLVDFASEAASGASAVAREITRGLPRLARLGQLQAHTQISLGKLLAEQAAKDPRGELFLYEDRVHTKQAVNERINRVVSGLLQVGVRQGEHVGVLMHTRPSAVVTVAALSRLGAVAVMLLPDTDHAEALRVGEATSVVTDPEHSDEVRYAAERVFVVGGGDRRDRPGASRQKLDAELVDLEQVDPENVRVPQWYRPDAGLGRDLAFVMFSESGGRLRAKPITNGRWALSAFGTASAARLSESDTVYCLTPISHSSGLLTSVGGALAGGSRIALTRTFEPSRFMAEVQRYGVTVVCYTWNLLRAILEEPGFTVPRYHPIRAFIGSGMSPELSRRVSETFGARVVEFYASTEGEVVLAKVGGGKPGTKGRRLPGSAEVALVDYYLDSGRFVETEDGYLSRVEPGEVGVLIGRADPDTTRRDVLLRGVFESGDAWFSTDHLFRQDEDGDYWMVDDLHDVALTGRGPVYAVPIVDVLEQLGQVDQAVVYRVHDGASDADGDTLPAPSVVAAVTLRTGGQLTAADLTAAFAGRHAQYPDVVQVVDEVPLTSWYRPRGKDLAERGVPERGPTVWWFDPQRHRYH